MSLTPEWKARTDSWLEALKRQFFIPLDNITFNGFTTHETLVFEEACKRDFRPMPSGTAWGSGWEYGWFRCALTVPPAAAGKIFAVIADTGAEGAIYINGRSFGAYDRFHKVILLSYDAAPGTEYELVIESYAGDGGRECAAGPAEPGRITVTPPSDKQAVTGSLRYGIWNETAYQLWIDVMTLYKLRECLDPESLRQARIDEALRKFSITVDFELPREQMQATLEQCRLELREALDCVNGSTTPLLYVFGHSHIDVAWLWTLDETQRKCLRTFSTQLELMERYPEFRYLQSQPYLYDVTRRKYPDLYGRIKEKVKSGQFIPEGGMWVEPDINISGGESLIRQILHGKRFLMEEFGKESRLCWLPDVFGFSASLPQILKGCGLDYFATHKIFWTYNEKSLFPYSSFMWEGIDGTRVLSHIYFDYCSYTDPATLTQRWTERVQKDGIYSKLVPFGHGDGGGGPTRDHLEYLRREKDLEGLPRTVMSGPVEFFTDLEKTQSSLPVYSGELYYQAHRGTYTSQAKTKRFNRKCELALREAEFWGTAANIRSGFAFDAMSLDAQWKTVLLNQFHDILPGSSIHKVYAEAEAAYAKALSQTSKRIEEATRLLTEDAAGITVFNSLSWECMKVVDIPEGIDGLADTEGNSITVQKTDTGRIAAVRTPACGWTTVYPKKASPVEKTEVTASADTLENRYIKVVFNRKGEIKSYINKESGRELVAEPCGSFRMYKDVPDFYDAWDIDSMYKLTPVELSEDAEIMPSMNGPVAASLRIRRKLNGSLLEQEIVLAKDSRRLDFRTRIDWQESHKLLKVCFPVKVRARESFQEIQFGYIARPCHFSTDFDKARYETCNHKWTALGEESHGFAILNDCKYGVDAHEGSINLTLLKSPLAPDMTADKGMQEFTYSAYAWEGPFCKSGVTRQGYELNTPVVTAPGSAGNVSLFNISVESIIIETVKPAEDGSGELILRLYESLRMSVKCRLSLSFGFVSASETNMLEKASKPIIAEGNALLLEFRPFEIKTVRIRLI